VSALTPFLLPRKLGVRAIVLVSAVDKKGRALNPDKQIVATEPALKAFVPFENDALHEAFVVGQLGQSLDGRIATISGESRWISGGAALDHLHRLRARVDAVVVGAGTIVTDDPQLTVRRVAGPSPARVVIDPNGRVGAKGKWLFDDNVRRILVSAGAEAPRGAELIRLPARRGRIGTADIVAALFVRGLRKILVEGGPRTLAAFIEEGCLDRLHVLVAPVIIGSGRAGLDLPPEPRLAFAQRPKVAAYSLGDGEVLFDCDFAAYRRHVDRGSSDSAFGADGIMGA
jgi:diaminohydroxyphosphoribosylaminopyrimidine deaminase/5-amino-6-(5-phosphoribosylamino)uracil reductase